MNGDWGEDEQMSLVDTLRGVDTGRRRAWMEGRSRGRIVVETGAMVGTTEKGH